MNEVNVDNNGLNKNIIIEQNSTKEFYTLNPEDYLRYSYSYTNPLYNSRVNYNDNPLLHRKYIGQFILGEKLGQGTFGVVVLGTHQLTGEKVAIKILEKEKIIQEADKTRIEREIKILKNMRHNNIVHLYDVKETASSLYIIMEYVQGKELFDYIVDKKRLSEIEACNFYQQIISGIEYLGKIRVVHRDLKPENLLLDNKKKIKIVDFGLSNIYPNNELLKTACGSPCYAAPEMINGELYKGLNADIWSSGIVLYAMLCGYLPFEDNDNEILYKKITSGKFKIPKFLSENCKDILHRILNVNPEKRFNIKQIKKHPWFNLINPRINMSEGLLLNVNIVPIDEKIVDEMATQFKFKKEIIRANLISNNHNHTTTTYYLLLAKKIREGKKTIGDMRSKEFLNYVANPVNLLSTYGYDLNMIIQIRNSVKTKENIEKNIFDNYKTHSGINMNKKNRYDKQISDSKIFFDKEKDKETIKSTNNKKNNDNAIIEVNGDDNKNKSEKYKKYNTKNESTKETLNIKNDESNTNNKLNKNQKILIIDKNSNRYESSITNEHLKDSQRKNKFNIKNKKKEFNTNTTKNNSLNKKRYKSIKPKRTITKNFDKKKIFNEKLNCITVTERNEHKKKEKIIQKLIKPYQDKKILEEESIINNDKEYLRIKDLMKKIKIKQIKNIKENKIKEKNENSFAVSKQNNQLYYLLTDNINKENANNKNNSKNIDKSIENEMLYNNGLNTTINESNKLAQKDVKINSFKQNKNIFKHIIIKNNILNNEKLNTKPKIFREISNNKRLNNKKGFIDTSISFDNSRGLTQDKFNTKNINKNKILYTDKNLKEVNHIDNNKLKDKDLKYLKLKAKNKKFGVIKIEEEYPIKNDDKFFSLTLGNKKKSISKRNRFENLQNPSSNYASLNTKNNNNKILDIPDDISSIKIKREKTKKVEESIKKISLDKKHLLTLLNGQNNYISLDQPINSNTCDNIDKNKTINNEQNSNNDKNNNFYQTYINDEKRQNLTLENNVKKRFFKSNFNTIDNNNKNKKQNIEEYFEPFDLSSIFFNKIDNIKEKIIKESENKKWKNRIRKKGCLLSKNNEAIDFNINKSNNFHIVIVKAIKKKGDIQKCKSFINFIINKLE